MIATQIGWKSEALWSKRQKYPDSMPAKPRLLLWFDSRGGCTSPTRSDGKISTGLNLGRHEHQFFVSSPEFDLIIAIQYRLRSVTQCQPRLLGRLVNIPLSEALDVMYWFVFNRPLPARCAGVMKSLLRDGVGLISYRLRSLGKLAKIFQSKISKSKLPKHMKYE